MNKPSYVKEIIDEVHSKDDPQLKEAIMKRVLNGYAIISDEISKELTKKEYLKKGIRF